MLFRSDVEVATQVDSTFLPEREDAAEEHEDPSTEDDMLRIALRQAAEKLVEESKEERAFPLGRVHVLRSFSGARDQEGLRAPLLDARRGIRCRQRCGGSLRSSGCRGEGRYR